MLKELISAIVVVVCALFILPTVILFTIWLGIYGVIIVPIVGIMYLIWRLIKEKGYLKEGIPPAHAKPATFTPKKKRMVKWQGKEIPLGVFISSMLATLVMLPIILFLLFFYVPPFWTIMIIGFAAGKGIAKHCKKEECHG